MSVIKGKVSKAEVLAARRRVKAMERVKSLLDGTSLAEMEAELLRRSIERADKTIDGFQTAAGRILEKQVSRRTELAALLDRIFDQEVR